jgi:D-alanyl-D-alanine carboxypeptidase (penicillin-binding protein 5/6)
LDYFNYYYLNDGSAAKVAVGEQISEYQALEGMLLPSANNLADSLGRWAFGSGTAYTAYANKMLKSMGLAQTTAGGPSGFADDTTSTAGDLVKIGLQAMANPIIAQIVEQPSATIPTAGEVKNLNWLLGSDGINGVKTGNTDKAGGCYLFAANRQVQGRSVLVIGAILGASDLNNAITAAKPLLAAADSGFVLTTPVHKGQVVGTYKTPWEGSAQALATKDLSVLAWKDKDIQISDKPQPVSTPAEAGAPVGSISLQNVGLATSSSLVLSQELSGPSWRWRIFHK